MLSIYRIIQEASRRVSLHMAILYYLVYNPFHEPALLSAKTVEALNVSPALRVENQLVVVQDWNHLED